MKALKSYTVRGPDHNDVRLGETTEGDQVVLSMQLNDDHGRLATMRLDRLTLGAFLAAGSEILSGLLDTPRKDQ